MAYSSETVVDAIYGTANANLWASPNGDEGGAARTTRKNLFIGYADALIDATLLAGSKLSDKIPFTTTPTLIQFISGSLAGAMMYEAWGVRDTDPKKEGEHQLSYHMRRAEKLLDMIARGLLELGV